MARFNIVNEIFKNRQPTAEALICNEERITFSQLKFLVDQSVRVLCGHLGTDSGRPLRVALHCPNGINHVVWSLAILDAGHVLVPIPPEMNNVERDHLVKEICVDAILCLDGSSWHDAFSARTPIVTEYAAGEIIQLEGVFTSETIDTYLGEKHPALIRFSSGTTSKRKGVLITHEGLLERVTACNKCPVIGVGDRVLWLLPMAHHFAVSIVMYLLHGATTIITGNHSAKEIQRGLYEQQATIFYGAPFHYSVLLSSVKRGRTHSLRLAVVTAAALDQALADAFYEHLGIPLVQAMGIIEVGLPIINMDHALLLPTAVGQPQPDFSYKIIDEGGIDVASGEVGELILRGPGMFAGYISPVLHRSELAQGGWFPTGDLARVDVLGNIYLVGRIKSVINISGIKVFPEEIETVLIRHDNVKEVRVVGEQHHMFGMIPVAQLVLETGVLDAELQKSLDQLCRNYLPGHKIPRRFESVDAIAKTLSGKIQRH